MVFLWSKSNNNMNKLVEQIFAEEILKRIEAAVPRTFHFPDKFKENCFESIDYAYECKDRNCTLDADSLWVMEVPQTRSVHCYQRKFYWRIEPNY